MSKYTPTLLASLTNEQSAISVINSNLQSIQTVIETLLSRDGTSPNEMQASFDMNSHRILNLPAAVTATEPLRLQDLMNFVGGSLTLSPLPTGGTTGQVLAKASNTNYDVVWTSSTVPDMTLAINTLGVNHGGTGFASYSVGDMLFASGAAALSKLSAVAAGSLLLSTGVGAAPVWSTATDLSYNSTNKVLVIRRTATTNIPVPGATSGLALYGGDTGEGRFDIIACASDAVVAFNRTNGAMSATTKVVAGDQMMGLTSGGIDTNAATTFQQGGAIGSYATGTWSNTSHPTEFRFYTIKDTTTVFIEAMRLLDSGGAWLNKQSTTAPSASGVSTSPVLQLQGANAADALYVHDAYGTGVAPYSIYRTARGTAGSFTATQINDTIGGFGWVGATGANTFPGPLPFGAAGGAFVLASARENWAAGAQGTSLQFYTTALTTAVIAISLCCQPSGAVSVGSANINKDYGAGNLYLNGGLATAAPAAAKTANYTMVTADADIIFNGAGTLTLTLLAAGTYPGREVWVKTQAAQIVNSASSNVIPKTGGAAGTAILAAAAGSWAKLKSNGTSWEIMASGT